MTNEYKEALLQYLTGTMQEETQSNLIIANMVETKQTANDLTNYLNDTFGSTYTVRDIIQYEGYNNYLLYGTRRFSGVTYGWMLIVDENFMPIIPITEYDTGTLLGAFYGLNIDESGNVYGVDFNPATNQERFIMLNNVIANGKATLRQSYVVPEEFQNLGVDLLLSKNPTSSNYLIIGTTYNATMSYQPIACQLTINVGSENEWKYFNSDNSVSNTENKLQSLWVDWSQENVSFKATGSNYNEFIVFYNSNDTTITAETYEIPEASFSGYALFNLTSVIANENTYYFGIKVSSIYFKGMQLYSVINGELSVIHGVPFTGETSEVYLADDNIQYYFKVLNGALMYFLNVPQEPEIYNQLIGIYQQNIVDWNTYASENTSITGTIYFDILQRYNLYFFNIQGGDVLNTGKVLYNPSYNFSPLTTGKNNPNNLKPLNISLYTADEIIFNRDLYNLVLNGSVTTSTVEVPNTMLNDINIVTENLIGNNYLQISSNNQNIITNIYETLHINIINTLSMINQDTSVVNQAGAVRLNTSVNQAQDYQNAIANKVKINYNDSSNNIISLGSSQITINGTIATYNFGVFIPINKTVTNIQIISNDENTVYQTIDNFQFESGSYYNISQKVKIV